MAADILFLLYLLNQLTDLAQIFTKLMQYLSLMKKLVKITYNKKQDGGQHTVFAISFEPIDFLELSPPEPQKLQKFFKTYSETPLAGPPNRQVSFL